MFDKLIESEPEGADFKNRRRYFMVSSVVVGVLFTTAVVLSIFAADYGLGSSSFELVEILAPHEAAPPDAEIRERTPAAPSAASPSQLPTRQVNMARVDEPTIAPTTVSTAPNAQMARPQTGPFNIGPLNANVGDPNGSGRETGTGGPTSSGLVESIATSEKQKEPEDTPPPPAIVKAPDKNPPTQSLGVVNGKASYLPKPVYSPAAIAVHAGGKVDVQVMIDEAGRVVSARAVSGHFLLRPAAEQAARNAKFTPTYLSKVPVKVTGVIVYNFMR